MALNHFYCFNWKIDTFSYLLNSQNRTEIKIILTPSNIIHKCILNSGIKSLEDFYLNNFRINVGIYFFILLKMDSYGCTYFINDLSNLVYEC